jgi:hypothetical protein
LEQTYQLDPLIVCASLFNAYANFLKGIKHVVQCLEVKERGAIKGFYQLVLQHKKDYQMLIRQPHKFSTKTNLKQIQGKRPCM